MARGLSSPCCASSCAANRSRANCVGSFVTKRPPKRPFFFCVGGEIKVLESLGNRSLPLEVEGLKTFSEPGDVLALGGVFDRAPGVLLGISETVSSFLMADFWADSCEGSIEAEFRYESLGTWAGFHSGRVGEVGIVACLVRDNLSPED